MKNDKIKYAFWKKTESDFVLRTLCFRGHKKSVKSCIIFFLINHTNNNLYVSKGGVNKVKNKFNQLRIQGGSSPDPFEKKKTKFLILMVVGWRLSYFFMRLKNAARIAQIITIKYIFSIENIKDFFVIITLHLKCNCKLKKKNV